MDGYPAQAIARDRFVLDRRPPRAAHDPWHSHGVSLEDERSEDGRPLRTATVFLTGRECPWRCVMCDLWRYTTDADTPPGAIASQIDAARRELLGRDEQPSQIKLYNAGSFFDPRAVPDDDYGSIAAGLAGFDRVIVESHPALVGPRTQRFVDALARHARGAAGTPPVMEVAMGLETTHPDALARINKRMTVEDFAGAARRLHAHGVALRVFLLVGAPFVPAAEQDAWLLQSVDTAADCGATAIALIPVRPGNGAMDALAEQGLFRVPRLSDLERAHAAALARCQAKGSRVRVFADLWDLERFSDCAHCLDVRRARLHTMNLEQRIQPGARCTRCGGASA